MTGGEPESWQWQRVGGSGAGWVATRLAIGLASETYISIASSRADSQSPYATSAECRCGYLLVKQLIHVNCSVDSQIFSHGCGTG